MAEITYQMVLSTLQTAGLLVGIFYYIMVLRNQQKNQEISLRNQELTLQSQEHALETRQATLFMQSYRETATKEMQMISMELLNWKWNDWDDYVKKYSSDPKQNSKRVTLSLYLHGLGILLEENYIPAEIIYKMDQNGMAPIMYWEKFKAIIYQERKRNNNPDMWKYFESYALEMKRLREQNGLPSEWSSEEMRFIE